MAKIKGFSDKQLRILAFPESKYDALICDGSIRAGKTSVMSVAFILWAMKRFNKQNFAICSRTVQTAVRNVIKPLIGMAYINDRYSVQFRRADSLLIVRRGERENYFYIYGGKDESSYTLIQGITLAGVLLDEVALMPKSFVEQALARCSVEGSKFWFNCNPGSPMHWFNVEWIRQPDKHNALHLHFTMDDNPSLSEQMRARYESMYSGVFYQRYIRGLWVAAEGLIYDTFDADRHVLPETPVTEGEAYVSCDYGPQNATVFLLWQKERGSMRWVCTKEYYYSGRENMRQKTVGEYVDDLTAWLDGVSPRRVIIDPSATPLKAELHKRGYQTRDADNDVRDGIADVSSMLRNDRIAFARSCKNTVEEFGAYMWDPKAADRGEDAPIKEHDHAMDAVRYFVRTQRLAREKKQYTSIYGMR